MNPVERTLLMFTLHTFPSPLLPVHVRPALSISGKPTFVSFILLVPLAPLPSLYHKLDVRASRPLFLCKPSTLCSCNRSAGTVQDSAVHGATTRRLWQSS